jgi:hypothetical protein
VASAVAASLYCAGEPGHVRRVDVSLSSAGSSMCPVQPQP